MAGARAGAAVWAAPSAIAISSASGGTGKKELSENASKKSAGTAQGLDAQDNTQI
jgi:hypothetical protein